MNDWNLAQYPPDLLQRACKIGNTTPDGLLALPVERRNELLKAADAEMGEVAANGLIMPERIPSTVSSVSAPHDPKSIVASLDSATLAARIAELEDEIEALKVLHRAAKAKEKRRDKKQAQDLPPVPAAVRPQPGQG